MSTLYPIFRSLLFRLDPERAHALTLGMMRVVGGLPPLCKLLRAWYRLPEQPVDVFGLHFLNPLGLAAGFDKDGLGWRGLACLGFGHIEIGTVTVLPQSGNPQPRLFRLPEDQALINRMGFPSQGVDFVAHRLTRRRIPGLILGVNIGKNKDTPLERADEDYVILMRRFAPLADYVVVNVSSPNTIGLRRLQGKEALDRLLETLHHEGQLIDDQLGRHVPLLVKLAPDLSSDELDDALQVILNRGGDGVIASNTTITRNGLRSSRASEVGGLSGKPLAKRSLEMVRTIVQRTGNSLPVIGVGGVDSFESTQALLEAGASLVQVYTGLVYQGPGLVRQIVQQLVAKV